MISRNYVLDRMKGFAILCVVVGHFFEPIKYIDIINRINVVIYSFHMAIFCIISGMLAKFNISKLLKWGGSLLFGQTLFYILRLLTPWENPGSIRSIIRPYFHFWYLYSLILWTFSVPVLNKLKNHRILKIIFSFFIIVAGLYSGKVDISSWCGTNRLVSFYPFFVLGFLYRDQLERVDKDNDECALNMDNKSYVIVPFVWISFLVSIIIFSHYINFNCLYNDLPYSVGKYQWYERLSFYGFGLLSFCALYRIMKRLRSSAVLSCLKEIGINSFAIYFWHAYMYFLYKYMVDDNHKLIVALLCSLLIVLLTLLYASKKQTIEKCGFHRY